MPSWTTGLTSILFVPRGFPRSVYAGGVHVHASVRLAALDVVTAVAGLRDEWDLFDRYWFQLTFASPSASSCGRRKPIKPTTAVSPTLKPRFVPPTIRATRATECANVASDASHGPDLRAMLPARQGRS